MEVEVVRPRLKRKRVSKKNKKNWRKYADVKDVEEYLEGRSREEIFGTPAAEKSNEELFFYQKSTNNDLPSHGTAKLTRRDIRHRPLKSEVNLRSNSSIKGFVGRGKKPLKRKHTGPLPEGSLESSSEEDEFDRSVSYRAIRHESDGVLSSRVKKHPSKPTVHVALMDLWGKEPEVEPGKELLGDEHYLKATRQKKIKKPGTLLEVPSLLKSVEFPHPGSSYNPSFEDHQGLLRAAVRVEEKKLHEAQKLDKKLQLAEMTFQQREKVWLEEMCEGILEDEKKGCNDGEQEEKEEEDTVRKRPIRSENRKTKKQRRKEHLRKKEEILRKLSKAAKMNMGEIYRLRSIKKEIARREIAISEKETQGLEAKKKSAYLTKRLGRRLYKDPVIPVKLSSEVTGSLRTLKPEGSIAMDRFKTLQKRNMIEPRELVRPHRKYKLLIKEKRSAKIPEDK